MSTRPRIVFDTRGWCNACCWSEEKKKLDWSERKNKLIELLENSDHHLDIIATVSGGERWFLR